ncbi:MAG TPA: ADP-forming succinate--CoA ligase subunit beta [Bacteroidales bacterium]|nr:ADP-forming succinate--CoA ligase subunit beta [Bacteroidales bacterium]
MNLHEYQSKNILRKFGVIVPEGRVTDNADEAMDIADRIADIAGNDTWVVKAQIHAGGRGKGGGVKVAKNLTEVKTYATQILGMNLVTHQTGPEGKVVHKVLIEQGIYYPGEKPVQEFYISVLLNRNIGRNMILYSPQGGMDIEAVAEQTPHLVFKEEIDPKVGIQQFQARRIAFNLGLSGKPFKEMTHFVTRLAEAYIKSDASLIEINPVIKTSDDIIMAADAKISLDDNALYRHSEYVNMRDIEEEDPIEVEAGKSDLNFVKLPGNVGCMVNGAGLAMATMDIIKLSGGEPANFLDVGGSANAKRVENGFRIILMDPNVKAILINIFGGIVRCDRVAQGVVDAYKALGNIPVPVIVRLQGTNAIEGKELIDKSGLKVYSAITLKETAETIKKILGY